jgi:hypothetical protein
MYRGSDYKQKQQKQNINFPLSSSPKCKSQYQQRMGDPDTDHYMELVERIEERDYIPDVFSTHPTDMFCKLAQHPDVQLSDLKKHLEIFPRVRLNAQSLMDLAANCKIEILTFIDQHNLHDPTIDKNIFSMWVHYYCGIKYPPPSSSS